MLARARVERGLCGVSFEGLRPALTIHGLRKLYSNGTLALDDVAFEARAGEVTVVLGHNGSGKSTLVKCIVRLIEPTSGSIVVDGEEMMTLAGDRLRDARRRIAVVFQNASLVGRRSAIANVATGCLGRNRALMTSLGMLPKAELERAAGSLDRVGMGKFALQRVDTLSGGQAQRIAIARALHQDPVLLLADEPVASLDPDAAADIMRLLQYCAREEGLAVVCVLHQIELATSYADRLVGMRAGRIVFDAPPQELSGGALAELYRAEPAS